MFYTGIVAPREKRITKSFFSRFKPDYVSYNDIHFVIAYSNQNYNRIFKMHNVSSCIIADNVILSKQPETRVINGDNFFINNLAYFILKLYKINKLNENSDISIIFDEYIEEITTVINCIYKKFRNIILVTDNIFSINESVKEYILNLGLTFNVADKNRIIDTRVAVNLSKDSLKCTNDTIIIDNTINIKLPDEYTIPPLNNLPYKIKKISIAEVLLNNKQSN